MTAAYITFSTGRRVAHWAGGGFAAPTVRKFSPIDGVLLHHGLPAWPPDLSGYSLAERHAGDIIDALRPAFAEGVESTVIFEPGRAIRSEERRVGKECR